MATCDISVENTDTGVEIGAPLKKVFVSLRSQRDVENVESLNFLPNSFRVGAIFSEVLVISELKVYQGICITDVKLYWLSFFLPRK